MIFCTAIVTLIVITIIPLAAVFYNKTYKILYKTLYGSIIQKSISLKDGIARRYFKVKTLDNIELAGYLVESHRPNKGIIVICHNSGSSKEAMWRYASFLYEAGYNIASFDFSDHGESGKTKKLIFNRQVDLNAIMKYIHESNHNNLPIGILGLSMGSVASLLYAAEDKNIKAIIVDGGPLLYIDNYPRYVAKISGIHNHVAMIIFIQLCMYITDLKQMYTKMKKALALLKGRPVLFIQGEKDFMCPPHNTEKALQILNSDKAELWLVKDANHLTSFAMAKEEYKERVIAFFDKHLANPNPPQ